MCGIIGTFSFSNPNFTSTELYLIKMRDTMIHRRPDGYGLCISKDIKIGLAHQRPSIIDLSEATNQPMSDHDGSK